MLKRNSIVIYSVEIRWSTLCHGMRISRVCILHIHHMFPCQRETMVWEYYNRFCGTPVALAHTTFKKWISTPSLGTPKDHIRGNTCMALGAWVTTLLLANPILHGRKGQLSHAAWIWRESNADEIVNGNLFFNLNKSTSKWLTKRSTKHKKE